MNRVTLKFDTRLSKKRVFLAVRLIVRLLELKEFEIIINQKDYEETKTKPED